MVRWMRCHCPPDTGFEIEPFWSTAEHTNSRSRRRPTIFNIYDWTGRKHFVSLKLDCQRRRRIRDFPSRHQDHPPHALRYCYYIYTNTLPVDLILVHRQGHCPTFFIFYSAQHIKCAYYILVMSLLSLTCDNWQVCFYSVSGIIVFPVPLWFSVIAKMKNIYFKVL